jgi:hypothetical protein
MQVDQGGDDAARRTQEIAMFEREFEDCTPEVLTDDELEIVAGGDLLPDAGGNIPICPPWPFGHIPGVIPSHLS